MDTAHDQTVEPNRTRSSLVLRAALVVLLLSNLATLTLLYRSRHRREGAGRQPTVLRITAPNDAWSPLSVIFTCDMRPLERLGVFGTEPLARLSDAQGLLRGTWFWQDARTLSFAPAVPFPKAQTLRLELSKGLTGATGGPLKGRRVYDVATRPLTLVRFSQVSLTPDRRLTADFVFDDDVSPSEFQRYVELEDGNGRRIAYELLGNVESTRHRVLTDRVLSDVLTAVLRPGLRGRAGPLGLPAVARETLELSHALHLREMEAGSPPFGPATICARFSSGIDWRSAAPFVRVEPEVKFELQESWRGLLLRSADFMPGTTYRVTFRAGMKSSDGFELAQDESNSVMIPDRASGLEFAQNDGYLSLHGNRAVMIRHVNLKAVRITVERVFENNLVFFAAGGQRDGWYRDHERVSEVVREAVMTFDDPRNTVVETPIDLGRLLGADARGALMVHAMGVRSDVAGAADPDEDDYGCWYSGLSQQRLVVLTDLGISVRDGPRDHLVYVGSVRTAKPVAGARVQVHSRANQVLYEGQTDTEGLVRFDKAPGSPGPVVVTARLENDLGYLLLDRGTLTDVEEETGGLPPSRAYQVLCFTDRGVYRPGETVHTGMIVRDAGWAVPPPFPVEVALRGPDRKPIVRSVQTIGAEGTAEPAFSLPHDALTGPYDIEVRVPGGKQVLGTTQLQVEEFMPERIKVELAEDSPPQARYSLRDDVGLTVQARYLSGQPLADAPVTARVVFRSVPFSPAGFEGFAFCDSEHELEERTAQLGEQRTDAKGNAILKLDFKSLAEAQPTSAVLARVVADVSEPSGRAVHAALNRPIDLYEGYLGIRSRQHGQFAPGDALSFDLVGVTPDGRPITQLDNLAVDACRVVWQTAYVRGDDGHYRYRTSRTLAPVAKTSVRTEKGRAGYSFTPETGGTYRISVRDSGGRLCPAATEVQVSWPWWDSAGAVEKPEKLALSLDRPSYEPGQTALLRIDSPFAGHLLVTVENDGVLETHSAEMDKGRHEISLTVREGWRPNVYCRAVVIRAVDPDSPSPWLPHRAAGIVRLRIDCSARRLNVALLAPEEVRPAALLPVTVRLTDAAGAPVEGDVFLYAVDEGILNLTHYAAPDPAAFFYGDRALGVAASDVYSRLLPEIARARLGGKSLPGGGDGKEGEFAAAHRLNPVLADPARCVALWLGRVRTGSDGGADRTFVLPRFTGSVRVVAVAAAGSRFGCAEAPVFVRAPFMVKAAGPRFLAPGDTCDLTITLINATGRAGKAQIHLDATGPVRLASKFDTTIDMAAGQTWTVGLPVRADPACGRAVVKVLAGIFDESADDEVELSVRPPAGPGYRAEVGSIEAGQSGRIAPVGDWYPGTAQYRLTLGASPAVTLSPSLAELLDYPYGCVEQTTSRCFPLLYLGDLFPGKAGTSPEAVWLELGIQRLLRLQTPSGGLGMWPGDTRCYDWGSLYAAHFLVEARRAGFDVPEDRMRPLLGYVGRLVSRGLPREGTDRTDCLSEKAYGCLVLAQAGTPDLSWMTRLKELAGELQPEARFMLGAAFFSARMPDAAKGLCVLPAADAASSARSTTGTLWSPVRQDALLLCVLVDTEPKSPHIPVLSARLMRLLQVRRGRLSTQELGFALLALGKLSRARSGEKDAFTVEIVRGGRTERFDSSRPVVLEGADLADGLDVRVDGRGTLYYAWTAVGVPNRLESPVDAGLSVRRQYRDMAGHAITGPVRRGQIVTVHLSLTGSRSADNLVVVDLLPAGFEIENPRLDDTPSAGGSDDGLRLSRVDARDDRLLLFGRLNGTGAYSYTVRAVTPGQFIAPPVQAECMYDPDYRSVSTPSQIRVIAE